MKKVFIIAAENSAETYGADVIEQFRKVSAPVQFFGVGGEKFKSKGVEILIPSRDFTVIGIVEILSHILKLKKYMSRLFRETIRRKADAVFLIDYPDFNLRLAKKFKKAGIPVYYYISPTIWAWRYSRVRLLKKYTDHLFIIFPFERRIFQKEKIPFTYVGHPLLPMIQVRKNKSEFKIHLGVKKNQKVISLLPGSREGEVKSFLPTMLKAVDQIKKSTDIAVFILRADSIDDILIDEIVEHSGNGQAVAIEQNRGHDLINASDLVISSCGTSNLEMAVLGVPFISVYRVHRLSYLLGIHFVKIKHYSIVNILAGEEIIPELIQSDFIPERIVEESRRILDDRNARHQMQLQFKAIKRQLELEGNPAEMIRKKILSDLFPNPE